jgi:predicted HTH transcriptional regulator
MLESFSKIESHLKKEDGQEDQSRKLNIFDSRQKKVLTLFEKNDYITSYDLEKLFKFSPRTARQLAQNLVKSGFLKIADKSKKNRKYTLSGNLL